ncbi:hypothetical protein [Burkholderia sp. 22PA0106]|uniref:hypothetical protein n=1 Tax=Burkholderia sp. 22PA0106 TaxID=3237371 RepID=UPI0039C05C82
MRKELLLHAAEEAVELSQALLKLARGDGPKSAVADEAADITALIVLVGEAGVIESGRFNRRHQAKLTKFRRKYIGR